jgi:hypothetical protein
MKEDKMYSTIDLTALFANLLKDGYTAINMKLITDLIELEIKPIGKEEK